MAKIPYEDVSGNYVLDEENARKRDIIEIDYDHLEQMFHVTFHTDQDDHFLSYVIEPQKLMSSIAEAVTHPVE